MFCRLAMPQRPGQETGQACRPSLQQSEAVEKANGAEPPPAAAAHRRRWLAHVLFKLFSRWLAGGDG